MNSLLNEIKELLGKAKISSALELLSNSLSKSSILNDDLLIIKGAFSSIEKINRGGLIKTEDYNHEIAKINSRILNLINEIETSDLLESSEEDVKLLIFDVDNTLLLDNETLDKVINPSQPNRTIGVLLKELVSIGYKIVFITGNDYNKQKPRVIYPILNLGMGNDTICFSDGGSRLFKYNPYINDFVEEDSYSGNNEILRDVVQELENEFNKYIENYIQTNRILLKPKVLPYKHEISDGVIDYIKPLLSGTRKINHVPKY